MPVGCAKRFDFYRPRGGGSFPVPYLQAKIHSGREVDKIVGGKSVFRVPRRSLSLPSGGRPSSSTRASFVPEVEH